MLDLKKKALGGIKGALEERMVDRMKPKANPAEDDVASPVEEQSMYGAVEGSEDPLSKLEGIGGDLAKLAPEEQDQLKAFLEKMGC